MRPRQLLSLLSIAWAASCVLNPQPDEPSGVADGSGGEAGSLNAGANGGSNAATGSGGTVAS